MANSKNKSIPPVVINVEADGKTSTYRLTRTKPTLALYFENGAAFNGDGEAEQIARRAGLFMDAALCDLAELPPEQRRAELSEHGLVTKEERNARPEWMEGLGWMPSIKDNRVVCPVCSHVSDQRVTPDTEFEHLPFVCPHCNSGTYISFVGSNVELEEP